jgi:hypothetical protein
MPTGAPGGWISKREIGGGGSRDLRAGSLGVQTSMDEILGGSQTLRGGGGRSFQVLRNCLGAETIESRNAPRRDNYERIALDQQNSITLH